MLRPLAPLTVGIAGQNRIAGKQTKFMIFVISKQTNRMVFIINISKQELLALYIYIYILCYRVVFTAVSKIILMAQYITLHHITSHYVTHIRIIRTSVYTPSRQSTVRGVCNIPTCTKSSLFPFNLTHSPSLPLQL